MPKTKTTKTILTLAVLLIATAIPSLASSSTDKSGDAPTYYKEVLPILQNSCQDCHRPDGANLGGMVAPMAFTTYADTRPWAKAIAKQVDNGTMPPWHASPDQHGVFVNERILEQSEIDTLVAWAKAGAPAGNEADAPPAREWPENGGWIIGQPDLEIVMGDQYFVEDDVEDIYVNFMTPITEDMLSEPRWVKAVEFKPGSPVVHHIVAPPLGGIAPGNQPTIYNDGYGTLLKPGDTVRWSMHYHKEPGPDTGVWDQSKVGLKFYPKGYTPEHPVVVDPLAKMDFVIPAGEADVSYTVSTKFERDTLLLSLLPHMHLRGKSAHYLAKYPDGTEEVLLEVPKYDFNWQTSYDYPEDAAKKIPAGTEVVFTATWDNSEDNPFNPDPTKEVRFGEPTTDEMMFGFLTYADAEPGYIPEGGGWLGGGSGRQIDPERIKEIFKARTGKDWDSLSPDEQKQIMERFSGGRNRESQGQSGGR